MVNAWMRTCDEEEHSGRKFTKNVHWCHNFAPNWCWNFISIPWDKGYPNFMWLALGWPWPWKKHQNFCISVFELVYTVYVDYLLQWRSRIFAISFLVFYHSVFQNNFVSRRLVWVLLLMIYKKIGENSHIFLSINLKRWHRYAGVKK